MRKRRGNLDVKPSVAWSVVVLGMSLFAASAATQTGYEMPEEQRLAAPDLVFRKPVEGKEPPWLHGWVEEEHPDYIVLRLKIETGIGRKRIERAEIRDIEFFEEYMLARGDAELKEGRLDDSERYYSTAFRNVVKRPENSEVRALVPTLERRLKGTIPYERGRQCETKGLQDDAVEFYDQVLRFDGKWPELKSRMEAIFLGRGKKEMERGVSGHADARNWIEEFLKRYPEGSKEAAALTATLNQADESLREEIRALSKQARNDFAKANYEAAESAVLETLAKVGCLASTGGQKQEDVAVEGELRELLRDIRDTYQVMKYGELEFPDSFDPVTARKPSERRLCQLLFDGLLDYVPKEAGGGYIPRLAERLDESRDGLIFDFQLKPNVKWSDGSDFTARDVEFTVELMRNPATDGYNPTWASIVDHVECVNPHRVRIYFAKQFAHSRALLLFKILPRHLFTEPVLKRRSKFCTAPVGTGPFVIQKITPQQEVELVRNTLFWGERPRLSKIVLVCYQDVATIDRELGTDAIQLWMDVDPLVVERFRKFGEDKFKIASCHTRSVNFLAMNFRKEIFVNKNVRLGMIHAIDRHTILANRFRGGAKGGLSHYVLTGIYPGGCPLYDDKVADYPYDPDQARRYFDAGGKLSNPKTITLRFKRGDENVKVACTQMAEQMKSAGFDVRPENKMEGDFFQEVYDKHDFDIVYWQYDFDETWDAFPLFDPDGIRKGGSNFMAYRSGRLCELFRQLGHEAEPQRWVTIGREIHRTIHEDLPIIPLWQLDSYLVYSAKLQDVQIHPFHLFASPEKWSIRPSGEP